MDSVHDGDPQTVQVQQARANLKRICHSKRAWIVGDRWHVRAIIIPATGLIGWRANVTEAARAELRKRFKAALDALATETRRGR